MGIETKKRTKIIIAAAVVILLIGGFYGLNVYKTYLAPNVSGDEEYLFVKTGANYDDLLINLQNKAN